MIGIKDMKMPKSCGKCWYSCIKQNANVLCQDNAYYCCLTNTEITYSQNLSEDGQRHPNCPLIEINEEESEE